MEDSPGTAHIKMEAITAENIDDGYLTVHLKITVQIPGEPESSMSARVPVRASLDSSLRSVVEQAHEYAVTTFSLQKIH